MSNNSKIYAYVCYFIRISSAKTYTQTDFENEFRKCIASEYDINTVVSS